MPTLFLNPDGSLILNTDGTLMYDNDCCCEEAPCPGPEDCVDCNPMSYSIGVDPYWQPSIGALSGLFNPQGNPNACSWYTQVSWDGGGVSLNCLDGNWILTLIGPMGAPDAPYANVHYQCVFPVTAACPPAHTYTLTQVTDPIRPDSIGAVTVTIDW